MTFSPCQAQMKCLKAKNVISHSYYAHEVQKWYLEAIALWKRNFFLFQWNYSIVFYLHLSRKMKIRIFYMDSSWKNKLKSISQWQNQMSDKTFNVQEVNKNSWNSTKVINLIFITKNGIKNPTLVIILLTNGILIKSICFILKVWLKLLKRYFRIFFSNQKIIKNPITMT